MDFPILEICDDELGEGWPRKYFHHLRQQLHANARRLQPQTPLPDVVTETDEMFQNAGEQGEKHCDPTETHHTSVYCDIGVLHIV